MGPLTPVFARPKQGYSATDILTTILSETPAPQVCTKKPFAVRTFASFVVDLHHVHLRDLHADDNGSWTTSSPRRMYSVEKEGDSVVSVKSVSSHDNIPSHAERYTLIRQYGIHKGTPEFRRIISSVRDAAGRQVPKAMVQYFFVGGEEMIVKLLPHGNSSYSKRPYYRTQPSTLSEMKAVSKSKPPSVTYKHMLEVCDDEPHSLSAEPRNKEQVYNARRSETNAKDEIYDLLEMLQSHAANSDSGYLRDVILNPTPCAVLASKEQLADILTFCCHSSKFGVFGVDATFELGNFYVTLTTYRNFLLQHSRTKKPPVMLGPAFLHVKRRFEDYHSFFSCLLKHEPRLKSLKAYGTDGEEALVSALEACFPSATSLRCFIHKRRNIEEKLKTVVSTSKKAIMHDIFGVQEGETFSKGLVDLENEEAFLDGLGQLEKRWNALAPGFHDWFTSTQAKVFCEHMIAPVRKRAQIPPLEQYTTNANESANSTVKKWVEFSKSTWPAFIEKLQNLVQLQRNESLRAIYGSGDYILADDLAEFHIDHGKWQSLTVKQKESHIQKMITAVCSLSGTVSMTEEESSVEQLPINNKSLSIPAEKVSSTLPLIPETTIKGIWNKAQKLLEDCNSIASAPGNSLAYMVISDSLKKPHFVQVMKNGRIVCDEQCPMWRGRRLCAHTVAVAEKAGVLDLFLNWLKKSGNQCNLTKLLSTTKEKMSAGTKRGVSSRKKGISSKSPISSTTNRIADVTDNPQIQSSVVAITTNSSDVNISNNPIIPQSSDSGQVWNPSYMQPYPWDMPGYPWSFSPQSYSPPFTYSSMNPMPQFSAASIPSQSNVYSSSVPAPQFFAMGSPQCASTDRPFVVKISTKRIKKCIGCGSEFSRKIDGSLSDPPNDLVVSREERRVFQDAQNTPQLSRLQNVYYHANLGCIRRRNPSFVSSCLTIPADLELLPVHRKYLEDHFGLIV